MRKNPLSLSVVIVTIPALLLFTFTDFLLAYSVIDRISLSYAVLVNFIIGSSMAVTAGGILTFQSITKNVNTGVFDALSIRNGIINGICLLGLGITKTTAIARLENPGYFSVMVSVYVLWLFLLNRYWLKREDKANPAIGFIIVTCSIGLAILSTWIN